MDHFSVNYSNLMREGFVAYVSFESRLPTSSLSLHVIGSKHRVRKPLWGWDWEGAGQVAPHAMRIHSQKKIEICTKNGTFWTQKYSWCTFLCNWSIEQVASCHMSLSCFVAGQPQRPDMHSLCNGSQRQSITHPLSLFIVCPSSVHCFVVISQKLSNIDLPYSY